MEETQSQEEYHFKLDEQETTFTILATDRSMVQIYSNDPVLVRRIERVGAKLFKDAGDGGKFYDLPANQLIIKMPPRKLTEDEKRRNTENLERARKDRISGKLSNEI